MQPSAYANNNLTGDKHPIISDENPVDNGAQRRVLPLTPDVSVRMIFGSDGEI